MYMDIDKINEFLDNINKDDLNICFRNLKIIIAKKENISYQKIITIGKQINDLFYEVFVIDIKNFKKIKKHIYEYSFFGDIKKILYNIIKEVLLNVTESNTIKTYYIAYTFNKVIPFIEESESITIDKRNIIETHNINSCIICYETYKNDKVEYKLKCDHSICRECFFNIILYGSYRCPMCRQIMV